MMARYRLLQRSVCWLSLTSLFFVGCIKKIDVDTLRIGNAGDDIQKLEDWKLSFPNPLTLYDIVEVALANNLDIFAQRYELEAQARISNAQHLRIMPPLTFDAFYNFRSRPFSSFSKLILPQGMTQPAVTFPEISSIQTAIQADVRDTINFLDTGINYLRAVEEKNRTKIVDQQHKRVRQRLILEVVQSYWKAIAAKRALVEANEIIALSEEIQAILINQIQQRNLSELTGLQVASRLIDQQSQLETFRYQYKSAIAELSGYMGIMPGIEFELADNEVDTYEIEINDLRALEEEAVRSRPELFVQDLQEQIAMEKIRESILQFLPNLSLYEDNNYDGNPFLVYNYWWSIGLRATWNLFLIPQQIQESRAAEAQQAFARMSRLALTAGVMSQVHIGYLGYKDALNQYKIAMRGYSVKKRLAEIAEKARESGEFQSIDTLNYATDALLSKINALRTFGNLKIAEEQLNYAVGKPLYFGSPPDEMVYVETPVENETESVYE